MNVIPIKPAEKRKLRQQMREIDRLHNEVIAAQRALKETECAIVNRTRFKDDEMGVDASNYDIEISDCGGFLLITEDDGGGL